MAAALGAAAARLATTLVAFDEGTPEYGGQVGQAPHERFLFSPQSMCRFVWHVFPTSYITGRILVASNSLVNLFFLIIKEADKITQD